MRGTGVIGAIALIILFLFISFIIFIIKLLLDLKVYKNKKYQPEETIKQKSAPVKNEPKKQVMYLIEKPPAKRANSNTRKELTYVSPKRIYMVDEKIEK